MSRLSSALLLLSAFAMGGCQSEAAGVRVICDAPINCPDCMNASPDLRMQKLAQHIDERLRNRQAREMFEALASADPATRQSSLSDRAKQLGIENCPLLGPYEMQLDEPVDLPKTQ